MSFFTNFGENLVCNVIRGQQPTLPSSFHLGLLTAVDESSYTEVSWAGYERQALLRDLNTWSGTQSAGSVTISSGTSHATSNNIDVDFGTVGEDATIVGFGLFAGNDMVAYTTVSAPIYLQTGDNFVVLANKIVFTLGYTGGATNYLVNKLIDWFWRGQDYAYPTPMWMCLYTALPSEGNSGQEVVGLGYERVSQASSAWTEPNDGTISNSVTLSFPAPLSDWGTVLGCGFYDAKTSGNLLWYGTVNAEKTIISGAAGPTFDTGAITLQVL